MGSIEDISKPKLVVTDMSKKRRMSPEEIGRAAMEAVERRHANDPAPSPDAPLAKQISWYMDRVPVRNIDQELQKKYKERIKKWRECNA